MAWNPAWANAIASIESQGSGGYSAVGPTTAKGNRAYGKYQVMDFNIPTWTEKHLGQRLTPEQFLASPEAQDAVFQGEFGSSVQKYGNPQDAASVWFTGRPASQGAGRSDILGTAGSEYVNKFNAALGQGPQTSTKGPQMMQEQKPQGLLGSLGIQKMEEGAEGETGQRFYQRDSFKDTAAVLAQGFGRMGIMGMEEIADGIAKQRTEAKAKNKTMEALSKMNTPQAQAAVEYINAGGDAVSALKMAFAKPAAGEVREINGKLVRVMPDNTVVDLVDGGPNKEDVAKLRKEFTDAQEVKTFVPIARQYANIISAASSGTGPGDISLVFSYMKLLDPTSSVQQGEQATAANAAGAPSKVRSLYNQLVGGGNLDNTARDQFVAAATELYENAKAPYDEKVNYYKGLAGQYGYNPENVVPETGYRGPTYTPWAQRPPPAAVAALKGNPSEDMMRQFDAKYGQGAAARALGR